MGIREAPPFPREAVEVRRFIDRVAVDFMTGNILPAQIIAIMCTMFGFGAAGAALSAAGLLMDPRAIASIAVLTLKNLLFILVACLKIKGATPLAFASGC